MKLIPQLALTVKKLPGTKVVVYDSGSIDGSAEAAAGEIPGASVIPGENRGFGFGNNRCLEQVDTEYTLFLNSDADITEESLSKLVKFLDENREYGAVQPAVRLWGWHLVTASRGVYLTGYGEAWDAGFMHLEPAFSSKVFHVPAVTAAVSLWRTELLRDLGGFDEGYFMYFEDADLSLRAQAAGWKMAVCTDAAARHMVGASSSRKKAEQWELASSVRLFRKFLGRGQLNRSWWRREIRILAGLIAGGHAPMKRIRIVAKGLSGKIEPVLLPDETEAMLTGEPGDMPVHRWEPGAPGPGWKNGMAAPWAGLTASGGRLIIDITGVDHAATGAVLNSSGDLLTRFTAIPGKTTAVALAAEPGVVYIKCDSSSSMIQVGV